MKTKNTVFIAQSIDGYIADRNNGLEWLETVPNPNQVDMGFVPLMQNVDAIVMGRNTYEVVLGFGGEWPYTKPVFVLSSSLKQVPKNLDDKVFLMSGEIADILSDIRSKGYQKLYIDGGNIIDGFLQEDLIDELIITTIPILLGGGIPLFKKLPIHMNFSLVKTEVFLSEIVQVHYQRKK